MNIADVLSGAAKWAVATGDCLDLLRQMPDSSVDSVVTDPPYGLAFMGKRWDYDLPDPAVWVECLRALKPGGHLLAFGGSRTYHRLACGVEDAGFEVRDQIMWVYGSGFPKSLDVGKAMDKAAGAEREVVGQKSGLDGSGFGNVGHGLKSGTIPITAPATDLARRWHGWGTALKPAHEPIVLARKPLVGTVAANVAEWGTGAVNVDGCRVEGAKPSVPQPRGGSGDIYGFKNGEGRSGEMSDNSMGRWPANLIHDGSEEVLAGFPDARSAGLYPTSYVTPNRNSVYNKGVGNTQGSLYADSGSAARFFYCAKANKRDRGDGNHHPTVKPTDLMRYLCRLITPPGGIVLDPFTGSGSTGRGAVMEGFRFVGFEREAEYVEIARRRIQDAAAKPEQLTLGGEP